MTALNFLCPYVADDYSYLLHFGTKERLQNIVDIIESMYIHCQKMNGRVVSHSIVQLFGLFPKWVFNFCNATVFTLLVYLMYRIANSGKPSNPILLAAIPMALWATLPAFGQVCLWYTGAVNYLWSLVGLLLFLFPYLAWYWSGEASWKSWQMVLFCIYSWLFGMYSEIASFVGIYLAAALILFSALMKKRSLRIWLYLPLVLACIGYLTMMFMPAQLPAKQADSISFDVLIGNFMRATDMLVTHCTPLLVVWCVGFVLGIRNRIGAERLILAVLMLTGAVGANYMTIVASYYPERCLCVTVMLLILSSTMMFAPYGQNLGIKVAAMMLAVIFASTLFTGVSDITACYTACTRREATIQECKANGQMDIVAEIVVPQTQYSVFWDLRDLSTDDPTTWPNFAMAKYYEINSILGVLPE